jgi:hypothetical protein
VTAVRTLIVAVAGFVLQTIGLAAFIAIASTSWNASGKLLVVGASFLAMALLLLFANSPYRFSRSVVQSALLALGFLIAHQSLTILFFRGLLKDIEIISIEHLRTVIAIFGLLFVMYLAGSVVAGWLSKFMEDWGRRAGAQ